MNGGSKTLKPVGSDPAPLREGIESLYAGLVEIPDIARGDREIMQERGRGYHPVQQGQKVPFAPRLHDQLSPATTDRGIPRQAIN